MTSFCLLITAEKLSDHTGRELSTIRAFRLGGEYKFIHRIIYDVNQSIFRC